MRSDLWDRGLVGVGFTVRNPKSPPSPIHLGMQDSPLCRNTPDAIMVS